MTAPRLAVLASGSGTILEAILQRGIIVTVVVADRPCRALSVAEAAGVEAVLLDRARFGGFSKSFDRAGYTAALTETLTTRGIGLVAMAGFGTITTGSLYEALPGRVLNTHPSLLPAFKGWHAVRDVLDAGVSETGCTVHVATESLDDGPILAQRVVPILPDDDEATLHERIKLVERELYPDVIAHMTGALS